MANEPGFYGDWDRFERQVTTFSDRLERNVERATRRNGEACVKGMKSHILGQKGEVKLSKLKPATQRRKRKTGKTKALIWSGQLVGAFTYRMLGKMKAVVGVKRYSTKGNFNVARFHENRFHFVRAAIEKAIPGCLERWANAFGETLKSKGV